jgi:uncharacterized protein
MDKLAKLKKIILHSNSAVIAFSGGVDSSFLLYVVSKLLPRNQVIAVTADSPTYPREELKSARRAAKSFNVKHIIIKTHELNDKRFAVNPVNRCYFCKKELFVELKAIARQYRLANVFDASNISDKGDFRPGSRAKKELGVISPLQEAGLNKEDIRKFSRDFKLTTWNKPAQACLASRIPYGSPINKTVLRKVEDAENILKRIGFNQVRIRDYNDLCRIEVLKGEIPDLIANRNRIIDKLKKIGYNYITVDLEGLRSGSMNEVIIK